MWFPQKHNKRVTINGAILKVQALQFNKILNEDETFKFSEGCSGDERFDMGHVNVTLQVNLHLEIVQQSNSFPDTLHKVIADDEFTDEQPYNGDETALKAACDALSSNYEVDGLMAWIEAHETPAAQDLSEADIAVSVKMERQTNLEQVK
jgi:hypothetical protein